jgi:hypothetical protein
VVLPGWIILGASKFGDRVDKTMSDVPIRNGNGPKVVVGSGWWYDGSRAPWTLGAVLTRSPTFFDLWLRQVHRCLRPFRIVVTDSAAPIKPDYCSDASLVWIEQLWPCERPRNPAH